MKNYPVSFLEKAERGLLNLSRKYPRIGDDILADPDLEYVLFTSTFDSNIGIGEIERMFSSLNDLGYLSAREDCPVYCRLSG